MKKTLINNRFRNIKGLKKHHLKRSLFAAYLILIVILSSLFLCGCNSKPHENNTGIIKIVTTIFPQYDFARAVTGELADVTMLLSPGTETHSFEPTPKDIKAIQNCDIFIYTGGESDSWLDGILESIDTSNITLISLMKITDLIEEEHKEGMESDDSEHDSEHEHDKEYDEHVWTSPINAIAIVKKIAEVVSSKDPDNANFYNSNANNVIEELTSIDEQFRQITSAAKRKLFVFGDRFPLLYFAKEYELDYFAAYPGCSSGTEFSPSTIAFLIDKVKEENIPVVFKIELSSDNVARTIADETGAKVLTFYSCHNISLKDYRSGETYISLMKKNIKSLKEALN